MALERDNACIQKYVPDNNEFKILEQLSLLLQPLKEITTIFSGRSYNTISLLYPSIHYLINGGLKEVSLSNPMILNLRENLENFPYEQYLGIYLTTKYLLPPHF